MSSGTALLQDFVIRKVEWKHFMMNILAAVHIAWYLSFTVIRPEINPTDHKSITARHFLRDYKRVEADFSICRDTQRLWTEQTPLSCASCFVPGLENTKDFFERVWHYQARSTTLRGHSGRFPIEIWTNRPIETRIWTNRPNGPSRSEPIKTHFWLTVPAAAALIPLF